MAFKALKDAGFVSPEVETMRQIAALRELIAADPSAAAADALRLQKLRTSGSL